VGFSLSVRDHQGDAQYLFGGFLKAFASVDISIWGVFGLVSAEVCTSDFEGEFSLCGSLSIDSSESPSGKKEDTPGCPFWKIVL
jgi:hypothetical protein